MRKTIGVIILLLMLIASAVGSLLYLTKYESQPFRSRFFSRIFVEKELVTPFVASPTPKVLPLEKYTIPNLQDYPYQTSAIFLTKLTAEEKEFNSYLFSYQTMGKTMTGTANVPHVANQFQENLPVIILVRGYATPEQYYPGFGTRNVASTFARQGYVTLAPDFFNFGESDPEPEDGWEARFIKPINVIELIKTVQKNPKVTFQLADQTENNQVPITLNPEKIGMWGHSNGGQISISVLEILSEPVPTTVWAPVTAPFPYSILYFTDTLADEGKEARNWMAIFEKDYDVFEFTITQHLNKLVAPLQIHHGSRDKDALQEWSDAFVSKIKQENERRKKLKTKEATKLSAELEAGLEETGLEEAGLEETGLEETGLELDKEVVKQQRLANPIECLYFVYPQADHDLQPADNWQNAINRDIEFFKEYLEV